MCAWIQALQDAIAQHDHRLRNAGAIRAELQDILAWRQSVAKQEHLLQQRKALDTQLQEVGCVCVGMGMGVHANDDIIGK